MHEGGYIIRGRGTTKLNSKNVACLDPGVGWGGRYRGEKGATLTEKREHKVTCAKLHYYRWVLTQIQVTAEGYNYLGEGESGYRCPGS